MEKGDIGAVKLKFTAVLGEREIDVKKLADLGEGSIIELTRLAGEPIDLHVGGKKIGEGEVVVIDENFGVRVTKVIACMDA